jgi:hypothetical protein
MLQKINDSQQFLHALLRKVAKFHISSPTTARLLYEPEYGIYCGDKLKEEKSCENIFEFPTDIYYCGVQTLC